MDTIFMIAGAVAVIATLVALAKKQPGAAAVAGIGSVIFVALACTYTLSPNEVGIEITRGRIAASPNGPGGWHGKAPWTKVEKLTVLPFTADAHDITMTNADSGTFGLRVVPRWHTDPAQAVTVYKNRRTSDEAKITEQLIYPLIDGFANDVAKGYGNDTTYAADGKTVVREGVPTASTLAFTEKITTLLAPKLAAKGIVLDDLTPQGKLNPSPTMQTALDELSAAKAKTKRAAEDVNTADQEATAARLRADGAAAAASKIPANLTPEQEHLLCVQVWAAEAKRASEKGLPMYVNPCGTGGSTGVLVGAATK